MKHRALLCAPLLTLMLAACGTSSLHTPADEAEAFTDETTPVTAAHPDFPNEDAALISPEGQRIIDAVASGQLHTQMQGDFDPALERLNVEGEGLLSAQGVSVTTMKKVYASSMSTFLSYRSKRYGAPSLDWSTDGCSKVPDSGPAFNFKNACYRHDFGYRNYKKYKIFTKANRKAIDDRFLADMKAHCATRSIFLKPSCYETAYIYYAGVRALGG
ncbi:hypothetical protein HNR42_000927 [Deinobacterium chartae]|uniref:Phospholipase A2 n=1 Tax=Deinobacterium chartae TaxID=521158 RepID=A0A841HZ75_9DEIO|nr:phospholipase [Deinobacterium chartae]MBB6097510.1 hypothetical protein [Deinobacterium chartae]